MAMLGSKNRLTLSGDHLRDRRQALTAPGQATWVDLDHDRRCHSCRHYYRRHCWLFVLTQRSRLGEPNYYGPRLPIGQRACTKFTPKDSKGENDMPSISERYGRKSFLKANDAEHSDLVLQIDRVDLDQTIHGELKDIVRFATGESLVLNQINALAIAALLGDDADDWPGKWIALYYDPDVEYNGKKTPGLRVRPTIPSRCDQMSDEIPF